ncbi:MAG: carbamoyltransferase HypF [Planctomycetaceae bacterium]
MSSPDTSTNGERIGRELIDSQSFSKRAIESPPVAPSKSHPSALDIRLSGRVQGVGMRPAITNLARQLHLFGHVSNTSEGVCVHLEGPQESLTQFEQRLPTSFPRAADVTSIHSLAGVVIGCQAFEIFPSVNRSDDLSGPLQTAVPVDLVACQDCLDEVAAPLNRRHNYPFTSCTNCGPRYSIIDEMPYDRDRTSMQKFRLCANCEREFTTSSDRRFHAQSNACPACGPRVWCDAADGSQVAEHQTAIDVAASAIRSGKILALRGLGGYQLLVDATSQSAVTRLRDRKLRVAKPFPVMVASLADARWLGKLDGAEEQLLGSPEGPIVVVDARPPSHDTQWWLAESVTSQLGTIGLMLPTTPLHHLLLQTVGRPLVCTSGNIEGEPLAYDSFDARHELQGIADLWLEHDRPIRRPLDDSVLRVMQGRPVGLRLARGFAPRPLTIDTNRSIVAVGGHQKGNIALSNGKQSILGPHLGNYDSIAMRERFLQQLDDLCLLSGCEPSLFAGDLHPAYFTTRWLAESGRPMIAVQHHHAHIVANMVEQGWVDREVLGVAWDGTGDGGDGTIWGGEFLLATTRGFQRVGHLRPFRLPGGETAIRQPWRTAVSLVQSALGDRSAAQLSFVSGRAESLLPLLHRPALSPITTSAGRLFEGLATLVMRPDELERRHPPQTSSRVLSPEGIEVGRYEGEVAMRFECLCDRSATGQYDMPLERGNRLQLDWRPMVQGVLEDRARHVPREVIAMRVHRGLAEGIVKLCGQFPAYPVALGGGLFQNRVLVELVAERFASTGQTLGLPGLIPPNDGGLAVGQLAIAAAQLRSQE